MGNTVFVDGHHMLHRVCFIPELQKLRASNGDPTGPVFGFLRVLRATLNRFKADSCVVCWDSPGTTVVGRRTELYPAYKANRAEKPKPEALAHLGDQLGMLFSILPYLNVKQMAVPGFEGDDLLYLLTVEGPREEDDIVTVVSEDKDLLQLVEHGADVYRPISDQLVTEANFTELTGIPSEAFVLRKAIVGDTSDNIKGVMGVGEKTADKLLRETYYDATLGEWDLVEVGFGNYDEFRIHCAHHRTKTAKKVDEQWDVVLRNIKLMDLSKNEFSDSLVDKATAILSAEANTLFTDVELIQELGSYEFTEITKSFATWITPFRRLR